MKYVRNGKNYISVPPTFSQKFRRDNFQITNLTQITAMLFNGVIDKKDIDIVSFLYDVKFATIEQVLRFCDIKAIEEGENRIKNLFSCAVINKFAFVEGESYTEGKELPGDAKEYFCMGSGGKQLLQQYSGLDYIDWEPGSNCQCAENVCKALLGAEVYLDMMSLKDVKLLDYERKPYFIYKMGVLVANAVYSFKMKDGTVDYIITDVIKSYSSISDIRQKLRDYDSLLRTNIWRRYWPDAIRQPMLFLFTDDDATALALAREINLGTKLKTFLISTEERLINRGIAGEGTFLRYEPESDSMTEIQYNSFA